MIKSETMLYRYGREKTLTRERVYLGLILGLTGFLSFYDVWKEGFGNAYYAAAVQSMLASFHNFFFAAFDAAGYVSVDKPPLGLWIQAFSATIFGLHGWSLILPQAVAAVISAALVYHLVQRTFGKPAGLVSALVFALTPILAAVSRTNNFDTIVVMLLLLAAWALTVAAEKGSARLLFLSVALVGLGFNVKMLQAFMVLPAFYMVYLLSPANKMGKKLAHLCVATVILLAISFSWAAAVDMTPADQRPYVGSSQTNSVIELAFGYNGIQRVIPGGSPAGAVMPGGGAAPAGFMGPGGEGGEAGIFRLFNQQMAGQISWLLPLAILGFIAALAIPDKGEGARKKLLSLCLWGMWLLPMLAYFSIAGFFHRYYLVMMAPAIAALCGIGLMAMWGEYENRGSKWYLLPASLAATAIIESLLVSRYPGLSYWLVPVICIGCLGAAAALVYARYYDKNSIKSLSKPAVACGVAALLVAPALWSATPIIYHSEAQLPYAGPELAAMGKMSIGNGPGFDDYPGLTRFLLNNMGTERFLVAVPNAMVAAGIILDTGKPVMAVGGFLGTDPILTADRLESIVANGELRYYIIMDTPGSSQLPPPGNSEANEWVKAHGKLVPENEWVNIRITGPAGNVPIWKSSIKLYDLKR